MRKPLTIAYLIFRTRENTGTKVVFQHVFALRKKGHQVSVYTLFGKNPPWFPENISAYSILRLIFTNPDVLIATFWPTAYVAFFLRAKKKFYCVMGWEEDFYTNTFLRYFARTSYRLPLRKIVLSDYLRDKYQALTKRKELVSKIMTFQIDDKYFLKKAVLRKRKKNTTILSVISWYNRYKGPDLLVKAIKEIRKRHPEYRFVLIGRETYSYSDCIDEFHSNPSTDEMVQLYMKADCMLITSRIEGFYIPGLEALANCLPVITTDSGGVKEYAIHNKTAYIVTSLSELWKKDIIAKVLTDTALRKRLVMQGFQMAKRFQKYKDTDLGHDLEVIYSK